MKLTAKALVLTTVLSSGSVIAACDKPTPPTMPDPDIAVTAQMMKAKNEIKAFISMAESYLACIESTNDIKSHNEMVDAMQATADRFNQVVRQYKARMKKA